MNIFYNSNATENQVKSSGVHRFGSEPHGLVSPLNPGF